MSHYTPTFSYHADIGDTRDTQQQQQQLNSYQEYHKPQFISKYAEIPGHYIHVDPK